MWYDNGKAGVCDPAHCLHHMNFEALLDRLTAAVLLLTTFEAAFFATCCTPATPDETVFSTLRNMPACCVCDVYDR